MNRIASDQSNDSRFSRGDRERALKATRSLSSATVEESQLAGLGAVILFGRGCHLGREGCGVARSLSANQYDISSGV